MKKEVKDKLILLIILSLATGFILLQPYKKTTDIKIEQSASKTIDKKDIIQFDCNNSYTEVSRIIDEQETTMAKDVCLYQQCSGFTY